MHNTTWLLAESQRHKSTATAACNRAEGEGEAAGSVPTCTRTFIKFPLKAKRLGPKSRLKLSYPESIGPALTVLMFSPSAMMVISGSTKL
jgi:hypothetical protein